MIQRLVVMVLCLTAIGGAGVAVCAQVLGKEETPVSAAAIRFTWLDVVLDSGDVPLAAYQVELRDLRGVSAVVGIEGGERDLEEESGGSRAFADPPYYDPAALMSDRVIIAALSTLPAAELPSGRTRVARLHLRIAGPADPDFSVTLHAAAGADANAIPVAVSLTTGGKQ